MILPVVKVPNSVLLKSAKPVKRFDAKLLKLIRDMGDTLLAARNPEGVGLAAPQIGVDLALFVTRPDKRSKLRAYINPQILQIEDTEAHTKDEKKEKTTMEGCLSIDRIWSPIVRPQRILMKYQTSDEVVHEEWLQGFKAVIMQHEIDHLNGILFTRRALEQQSVVYEEKNGELQEIEV